MFHWEMRPGTLFGKHSEWSGLFLDSFNVMYYLFDSIYSNIFYMYICFLSLMELYMIA